MKQSVYCLACESWEQVEHGGGHLIIYQVGEDEYDADCCYGPFVYSEPPAPLTEQEWQQVFTTEPAADEMVLLEKEASNFFVDAL